MRRLDRLSLIDFLQTLFFKASAPVCNPGGRGLILVVGNKATLYSHGFTPLWYKVLGVEPTTMTALFHKVENENLPRHL